MAFELTTPVKLKILAGGVGVLAVALYIKHKGGQGTNAAVSVGVPAGQDGVTAGSPLDGATATTTSTAAGVPAPPASPVPYVPASSPYAPVDWTGIGIMAPGSSGFPAPPGPGPFPQPMGPRPGGGFPPGSPRGGLFVRRSPAPNGPSGGHLPIGPGSPVPPASPYPQSRLSSPPHPNVRPAHMP